MLSLKILTLDCFPSAIIPIASSKISKSVFVVLALDSKIVRIVVISLFSYAKNDSTVLDHNNFIEELFASFSIKKIT